MKKILAWLRRRFLHPTQGIIYFNVIPLMILSAIAGSLGWYWDAFPIARLDFSHGIYDKDFWKNCLINLHSSIFDFFVLTVVFGYFAERLSRSKKVGDETRVLDEQRIIKRLGITAEFTVNVDALVALRRLVRMEAVGVDASELNFSGLVLLKGERFVKTNLSDAVLEGAGLAQVGFDRCIAKRCKFSHDVQAKSSDMQSVTFYKSDMEKAVFVKAKLSMASFTACNLQKVNFHSANLKTAKFKNCKFNLAVFDGCDLSGAEFEGTWPSMDQFRRAHRVQHLKVNGVLCRDFAELGQMVRRRF